VFAQSSWLRFFGAMIAPTAKAAYWEQCEARENIHGPPATLERNGSWRASFNLEVQAVVTARSNPVLRACSPEAFNLEVQAVVTARSNPVLRA
jgi:hypothetical protein